MILAANHLIIVYCIERELVDQWEYLVEISGNKNQATKGIMTEFFDYTNTTNTIL